MTLPSTPNPLRRRYLLGALGCIAAPAVFARSAKRLVRVVPPAYCRAALAYGVPPRLHYAVAMQESAMLFNDAVLPWLWTLNVRGTPHRYATYGDGCRALELWVTRHGITNVDCGPMQINWHYHSDKLGTFAQAMDPTHNLNVGASILARHYAATGDWYAAVGRYHSEADPARARTYASGVFARMAQLQDGTA